jgi:hypothetical protein
MIRDLFHSPPIYKANIILSWKPRDAKGKVSQQYCGFGSVRIRIIFQYPDLFPGVLGSGSVSYSNEHNKINWKGIFNKVCLLVGSFWTY